MSYRVLAAQASGAGVSRSILLGVDVSPWADSSHWRGSLLGIMAPRPHSVKRREPSGGVGAACLGTGARDSPVVSFDCPAVGTSLNGGIMTCGQGL
jgi:hypothetical protein